jgi:hypothetical protein
MNRFGRTKDLSKVATPVRLQLQQIDELRYSWVHDDDPPWLPAWRGLPSHQTDRFHPVRSRSSIMWQRPIQPSERAPSCTQCPCNMPETMNRTARVSSEVPTAEAKPGSANLSAHMPRDLTGFVKPVRSGRGIHPAFATRSLLDRQWYNNSEAVLPSSHGSPCAASRCNGFFGIASCHSHSPPVALSTLSLRRSPACTPGRTGPTPGPSHAFTP